MSSKKILGVEFAPLNIPLERRKQTACILALLFIFTFIWWGSLYFLLFLLFFTRYYYISVLCFVWLWFDKKTPHRGGRRLDWVRRLALWTNIRDYFPIKLIKTAELDPSKNYLCGYHPHGILPLGATIAFNTEALNFSSLFPNIKSRLLTLNEQFYFPFYRDIILSGGGCAVSRESIQWLLTNEGKGNMAIIVLGGARESLDAHPGMVRLILKRRKGFIRIALKEGASLIPIFGFGENETYAQTPNPEGSLLRRFQDWFTNTMSYAFPLIHGRGIFQYSFGLLPFRVPINVIVGKPIDVKQNPNPTEEEVDHYHRLYVESLTSLYEEHKVNYDLYKELNLEII